MYCVNIVNHYDKKKCNLTLAVSPTSHSNNLTFYRDIIKLEKWPALHNCDIVGPMLMQ